MGGAHDELMVVLVDDIHVTIFRDSDRLRFGLSSMGSTIPEIYPATPRAQGNRQRRFRNLSRSVLEVGRRLGVDGVFHWDFLGCLGALVALRQNCIT